MKPAMQFPSFLHEAADEHPSRLQRREKDPKRTPYRDWEGTFHKRRIRDLTINDETFQNYRVVSKALNYRVSTVLFPEHEFETVLDTVFVWM